MIGGSRSR